jgi:hypothetical protein
MKTQLCGDVTVFYMTLLTGPFISETQTDRQKKTNKKVILTRRDHWLIWKLFYKLFFLRRCVAL